jgi:hypothetical protein
VRHPQRLLIAVLDVLCRPVWSVLLIALAFGALTSLDARATTSFLTLLLVLVITVMSMRILGASPFNPLSVLQLVRKPPSVWRLLGSSALFLSGLALLRLEPMLLRFSASLAASVSGDRNLMAALLIAAGAALVSATLWGASHLLLRVLRWQAENESAAAEGVPSAGDSSIEAREAVQYRRAATGVLVLAVIALVPAALLASWAVNVAASVVLPVFVLSVQHRLGRAQSDNPSDR